MSDTESSAMVLLTEDDVLLDAANIAGPFISCEVEPLVGCRALIDFYLSIGCICCVWLRIVTRTVTDCDRDFLG